MEIGRPHPDALVLSDERFAHFLPLALGGMLFRAAGKGLKKLAGLAISGAKAGGRAVTAGAKLAARTVFAEPAPEEQVEAEFGGTPPEEYAEEFDVLHDGGDEVALVHPAFADMEEEQFDELAAVMADEIEAELSTMNDGGLSPYAYDTVEHLDERFAHFKKFKKKLKKLKKLSKKALGAVGGLAGKLGPLASMVPGLGTVAGAGLSAFGSIASKAKSQARSMVPEEVSNLIPGDHGGEYELETGGQDARRESQRVHRIASLSDAARSGVN